jgi:hypothetical protein
MTGACEIGNAILMLALVRCAFPFGLDHNATASHARNMSHIRSKGALP